ncbi:MAG: prepilin-type N-terminal cleavage/methylation domain-containing protein [Candidatus Levyibacteriota bacterium]
MLKIKKIKGFTPHHNICSLKQELINVREARRVSGVSRKVVGAGFTLIELLIYLGIFSMLLLVLVQLFTAILDVQLDTEATSGVQEDGKYLFSRLNYDIGRASDVKVPLSYGVESQTLTITINSDDYVYSLNNGNLMLGADQLNGNDTSVSNLSFMQLGQTEGKSTIKVAFTLTSKTIKKSGPESKTFQTAIGLR